MPEGTPPDDRSPPDAGEVDPELMELADQTSRPSVLKPILYIGVVAVGCWFLSDWLPEMRYVATSSEPVELGQASELGGDGEAGGSELPHNKYVAIEGIPSRRAGSDRYRFFKVIGANIYVSVPTGQSDAGSSPLDEASEGDEEGSWHRRATDRPYFDGAGRLMALPRIPERYTGLRAYYRKHYGTRFCGVLGEDERRELERKRRAAIVENWEETYREASPDERRSEDLTRRPSDEEIRQRLRDEPVCDRAYLLQAGVSPRDHWWYLAVGLLFVGFMLVNVWWLIRWIRRITGGRG